MCFMFVYSQIYFLSICLRFYICIFIYIFVYTFLNLNILAAPFISLYTSNFQVVTLSFC